MHACEEACNHACPCALHATGLYSLAVMKHRCGHSDVATRKWQHQFSCLAYPMFLKASTWPHVPSKTAVEKLSFLFFFCIWPATLQNLCHALSIRKSYEFEDLLQSSTDSCRVDWYAQSRLGLTRTLSEENVYEDIIGKQCISHFIFYFSLTKWNLLQTAVSVKIQRVLARNWFVLTKTEKHCWVLYCRLS